jgi:hypothetical protein
MALGFVWAVERFGDVAEAARSDRGRSEALAMFEHQGAFTAGKDGAHLGGQAFHPIHDSFSLVSRSEVYPHVSELDRCKVQPRKPAFF